VKRPNTVVALLVLALAASFAGVGLAPGQNYRAAGAEKSGAQARNLEIYWIDTEGGAATLIVSPSGESMLIDTGYPDGARDATRILETARHAGLKKIDHLVISHYHRDHVGGLAVLSRMIPIGRFYGPGDKIETVNQQWLDSYTAASDGKRKIVKPGDRIQLKDVQVLVVTADEKVLAKPVNGGGPNPLCADAAQMSPAGFENARMVGVLLTYGKFTFLNLIDLDWYKEMELACPVNKLGKVTLYQTSRHGSLDGAGAPAFLAAIAPQVVVVNNGPNKGLGQTDKRIQPITVPGKPSAPYEKNAYLRLAGLPGIEGIWQGHLSLLDKDPRHNTSEAMIANLEDTADCKGNWIKASIARDGKFTITNGRNGYSKTYAARQ
jgi:competence protein ComEC